MVDANLKTKAQSCVSDNQIYIEGEGLIIISELSSFG